MEIDITTCEKYIRHLAKKYNSFDHVEDMIQEGFISTLITKKKFNPENGASFLTYCDKYIKSAMYEYWYKNFNTLKLDNNKLNKKILTQIFKYNLIDGDNNIDMQKVKMVSETKNIPIDNILFVLNYVKADTPLIKTNENGEEYLSCEIENDGVYSIDNFIEELDKQQKHDNLNRALNKALNEREREIIIQRFFHEKITYKELGKKYNCSGSRIEQLEKRALKKLKKYLTNLNGDI